MDLVERAGHLKPMLVEFALSPRFDRELSAVIARNFPGGIVTDESVFSMVLDTRVAAPAPLGAHGGRGVHREPL